MALRRFFRDWGFTTSALLIFGVVVANYFITLPYYIVSPGSARGVSQYLEVPPDRAHPAQGDVLLTTVSLTRARPADLLWAYLTPNNRIEKQEETIGEQTPEEFLRLAEQAMDDSKQTAIAVAMRRAGYEVRLAGDGAHVAEVIPGSPADGELAPGDVITRVGDRQVAIASDVTEHVRTLAPGTTVPLQVKAAAGGERSVEVTTAPRPDGTPGVFIGVLINTHNPRLDTPFPVNVADTDIGGPSAGLAFSLALVDQLTPGELTGGGDIAVTGTIRADGSVGPVGGVEQKALAVNKSDAELFLVPPEELEEARKRADDDLKVIPVRSLDEAIRALAENGGDISGLPGEAARAPAA